MARWLFTAMFLVYLFSCPTIHALESESENGREVETVVTQIPVASDSAATITLTPTLVMPTTNEEVVASVSPTPTLSAEPLLLDSVSGSIDDMEEKVDTKEIIGASLVVILITIVVIQSRAERKKESSPENQHP